MQSMKPYILLVVAGIVTGCAVPMKPLPPKIHIAAPYDSVQASLLLRDGANTLKGNAFMRQRGGGVVTCAGKAVILVPATAYARERIEFLYRGKESGATVFREVWFEPDPPEYVQNTKQTKCDSQGNFLFERVADGEFFVTTSVNWQVGYSNEGGSLVAKVVLKNGQTSSVILSP